MHSKQLPTNLEMKTDAHPLFLAQHGVNVKHLEYFADNPSTGMDPSTREEN